MLNTGNGTFHGPIKYSLPYNDALLSISDFNNDKNLDVMVGYINTNKISVHFNTGDGVFTNQTIFSISFFPKFAKPIDINGDGKMEIIVISDRSSAEYIGILSIHC